MADKINAAGYETKPWWPYVRELMEGGGSVTVEQLNVTENGTYTAEAGKAYSPVVVNVPSGSSDFRTSEVTFINNSSKACEFNLICITTDLTATFMVNINETIETNVVFYQNNTEMTGYLSNFGTGSPVVMSFTGDIEDDGDGYFIVSGAGTVTITDAS